MSPDKARSPQVGVFISHSDADKELADAIHELLVMGVGVPRDAIFCSSVAGAGLEQGKHFVEDIREKIRQAKVVVLLISPNYLASMFCNCELGASWAFGSTIFPIVVPPLTRHDIKSVLTGIQQGAVNVNSDLADLRDFLVSRLGLQGGKTAAWEAKRDKFTQELPKLLAKLPRPAHVELTKHDELEKKYRDAIRQLQEYQEQLKQKEALIEELKKCKDRDEVVKAILVKSGEQEAFQILMKNTKRAVEKLPSIVRMVLLHRFLGRAFNPDSDDWPRVQLETDRKFLKVDGPAVFVNEDDPKVTEAIEIIEKLKEFLKSEASYELADSYQREHGYYPEVDNMRFWEDNLLY